jgi:murein DD-endopeptidase MepM/ murein hydrolase activator NlpD
VRTTTPEATARAGGLRARMTRTRVTAAIAALALVPVSVLAGAVVAPSYAASVSTIVPTAVTADAPDITWDDVAAAQASVDATAALVAQLKAQLALLQAAVDKTQADADAKGVIYGKAQDAYDAQEYTTQTLQSQADAAQKQADTAKKTAGQLLAQVSKSSGGSDSITASLLGNASQADSLLSRLSYMSQISDRSKQVYAKALQLQKSAQALTDQADAASKILAKLKDTAQAAFATAQAAADAAAAALAAQQAAEAQLQAKLDVLQQHRDATLADYNAALVAKWGPGAAGVVSASGWANPANGYLGDRFGMRWFPVAPHGWRLHTGQDISGTGCGAPIYAAHSGTVTYAGPNGDLGNFIQLDNGDGISTGYGHIVNGGILVRIGQHVAPGQQIAKVGTTGASTGCHLHFMVRINGALTDPLPFMRDRGITLGS